MGGLVTKQRSRYQKSEFPITSEIPTELPTHTLGTTRKVFGRCVGTSLGGNVERFVLGGGDRGMASGYSLLRRFMLHGTLLSTPPHPSLQGSLNDSQNGFWF